MDFGQQLKQFSTRIDSLKTSISTEEATKTSIIMPFFSILGYDVFNPNEFLPEYVADVGIKKGEKVDYAILIDGQPTILIEAKSINKNLEKHDSQLFRYFSTTVAKFAILTNGVIYRFYTDMDEVNKMDKYPFLEINILDLKESDINELKKFCKDNFDMDKICNSASFLKYVNIFKSTLNDELVEPSDEFVKLFLQGVHKGPKTQTVIEKFRPVLKKSLNEYINDKINEKIKQAIGNTESVNEMQGMTEAIEPVLSDDEQEAFFAIKNILKNTINMSDISYKITDTYLAILYKNNTRKWICRFIFNSSQKSIIIPDENKNELKYKLLSINDIYKNEKDIIETVLRYSSPKISAEDTKDNVYVIDLIRHTPRKKRVMPNKYLRENYLWNFNT